MLRLPSTCSWADWNPATHQKTQQTGATVPGGPPPCSTASPASYSPDQIGTGSADHSLRSLNKSFLGKLLSPSSPQPACPYSGRRPLQRAGGRPPGGSAPCPLCHHSAGPTRDAVHVHTTGVGGVLAFLLSDVRSSPTEAYVACPQSQLLAGRICRAPPACKQQVHQPVLVGPPCRLPGCPLPRQSQFNSPAGPGCPPAAV